MFADDRGCGSNPYFKIEFLTDLTGLRLTGEADMCAQDHLRAAIAALPLDATAIHLQLGGLRFIDVGCTSQLVALAGREAQPRLVLYCPPPMLPKIIALLWPEATSSCLIVAERRVRPALRR